MLAQAAHDVSGAGARVRLEVMAGIRAAYTVPPAPAMAIRRAGAGAAATAPAAAAPESARPARGRSGGPDQAVTTGIFPIFIRHSAGPVLCTDWPVESTATVTGMSLTSNS